MNFSSLARAWFVLSVAILGVMYGVVANQWRLFPSPQLRVAWNQAEVQLGLQSPRNSWSRSYDREGVRLVSPQKMQPGLTFVATSWDSGVQNPSLTLVDEDGEVVHRWNIDPATLFPDTENSEYGKIHGSLLLPGGDVIFNIENVGTVRMNSCSDVKWKLGRNNHHSISRAEDGSFWVPGSHRKEKKTEFPGLGSRWGQQVLHVSAQGEVIDAVNILEVLFENDLERRMAKTRTLESGADLTHVNDVEPLSSTMADEYPLFDTGDLLMSLRAVDLVLVFDPESLNVKWYSTDPFIAQHDPDFEGDGWIGIFDNNVDYTKKGTMLGGSRIVSIQPHTDSVRVRFPTEHSELFYTQIQGKWEELQNGNLLLAEAAAGRIVEVGPDGRTVWELVKPGAIMTKAARHDLTKADVASWACSSVDSVSTSAQNQQTAP